MSLGDTQRRRHVEQGLLPQSSGPQSFTGSVSSSGGGLGTPWVRAVALEEVSSA